MDLMGASSNVLENDTGITICSSEGRVSMRSSLNKHFNRGWREQPEIPGDAHDLCTQHQIQSLRYETYCEVLL